MLTGENRLDRPLAELILLVEQIAVYNDPRCTHDGGRAPGKPSSRPPGRQQCEGAVKDAERILKHAMEKLTLARDGARIRSHAGEPESFGGGPKVEQYESALDGSRVTTPESALDGSRVTIPGVKGPHVKRRGNGQFDKGVSVTHLAAKMAEAICGHDEGGTR